MCLALYKPAKASLNREEMATAFENNPDGAGFAYFDPAKRKVEVMRGYFDFETFWRDLRFTMDEHLAAIVHFRVATHGSVDADNCHPFKLDDGALIHNGIIQGMTERTFSFHSARTMRAMGVEVADRSDTRVFVEDYLKGMAVNDLERAQKLIEKLIGWSKLVTIHDCGSVLIFNEHDGHWRNGVWYSNDSYMPDVVDHGGSSSHKSSMTQWPDVDDGEVEVLELECAQCSLVLRTEDFSDDWYACPECGYVGHEAEAMQMMQA